MSTFDDDDFFSDDAEEDFEEEEASLEDVKLAELGIQCNYASIYKKHNPGKKIFNGALDGKKLTKGFMAYYLGNCDQKMIDNIQKNKLSKPLRDIIEKTGATVSDGFGKEELNSLKEQVKEQHEQLKRVAGNLIWLYRFMSNKMQFKDDAKITEDDMNTIKAIEEATNQ